MTALPPVEVVSRRLEPAPAKPNSTTATKCAPSVPELTPNHKLAQDCRAVAVNEFRTRADSSQPVAEAIVLTAALKVQAAPNLWQEQLA